MSDQVLAQQPPRRWLPRLSAQHVPLIGTAVVCVVLYLVAAFSFDRFATLRVFLNFLGDNAFMGVTAVGMTFAILAGGIDLSVGSVVGCSSIIIATLITKHHLHPALAILIVLAGGTLSGAVMGALIRFYDLPAFLVTLGGLFFYRGLGLLISQESISIRHPLYANLSDWSVHFGRASLSVPAMIFLATLIVGIYLLRATRFGRNCYALGGSEQSSFLMGLPTGSTKIGIYALSGFCSALGGVVYTLSISAGDATSGSGLELDVIAAVVVGGTLLTGGFGSLTGTLLGVLIFAIIKTGISFQGHVPPAWIPITTGLLLLAFVLLQKLVTRKGNA